MDSKKHYSTLTSNIDFKKKKSFLINAIREINIIINTFFFKNVDTLILVQHPLYINTLNI